MDSFNNPYLIAPLVTWAAAQVLKFGTRASRGEINFYYLWQGGGLLSSHVAVVTALAVTAYTVDGLNSALFGISATLAGAVIYDAATIGRTAWRQSAAIHSIVQELRGKKGIVDDLNLLLVPERNQRELIYGMVWGTITALILTWKYWSERVKPLGDTPGDGESFAYLVAFGVVLLLGLFASRFWARRQLRRLPTSRRIRRAIRATLIAPAVIGLAAAYAERETLKLFDERIWPILIIAWIVVGTVVAYRMVYGGAGARLQEEAEHFKKQRAAAKPAKRKKTNKRKR